MGSGATKQQIIANNNNAQIMNAIMEVKGQLRVLEERITYSTSAKSLPATASFSLLSTTPPLQHASSSPALVRAPSNKQVSTVVQHEPFTLAERATPTTPKYSNFLGGIVVLGPKNVAQQIAQRLNEGISNRGGLTFLESRALMSDLPDSEKIPIAAGLITNDLFMNRGWVLNGFPTTRAQAEALEKVGIYPDHCIVLSPSKEQGSVNLQELINFYGGSAVSVIDGRLPIDSIIAQARQVVTKKQNKSFKYHSVTLACQFNKTLRMIMVRRGITLSDLEQLLGSIVGEEHLSILCRGEGNYSFTVTNQQQLEDVFTLAEINGNKIVECWLLQSNEHALSPFAIATGHSTDADPVAAVNSCYNKVFKRLGATPSLLLVHSTCNYKPQSILDAVKVVAPGVPIHGGTSSKYVMSDQGQHRDPAIVMWAVRNPAGRYGVGACDIGDDPDRAARKATEEALNNAGVTLKQVHNEKPKVVWLTAPLGKEEALIKGIEAVIGRDVPITGGSAADEDITGKWFQLANNKVYTDACVVTVMYPTVDVFSVFDSCFTPTAHTGVVTKAHGRCIEEIDHKPAATVYNKWSGGIIDNKNPGTILFDVIYFPIGKLMYRDSENNPHYQLLQPSSFDAKNGLTFLGEAKEGDSICLMTATKESMIAATVTVAANHFKRAPFPTADISGALAIYCVGYTIALDQEDITKINNKLYELLNKNPFIGCYTFGEQGPLRQATNQHGNLMFSFVLFGTPIPRPVLQGSVAIVFTDVEGSTQLWEKDTETMSIAIDEHNEVLRSSLHHFLGYEVKTEGDSFMVAFDSPTQALAWCLFVQKQLLIADWPEELLRDPKCAPVFTPSQGGKQGKLIWRGLKVRMGIHFGTPKVTMDPLTARLDFFGPAVNRASRVSTAGHGGQILVSGTVYDTIVAQAASSPKQNGGNNDGRTTHSTPDDMHKHFNVSIDAIVSSTVWNYLGEHMLKGLEKAERLYQVLPFCLEQRVF